MEKNQERKQRDEILRRHAESPVVCTIHIHYKSVFQRCTFLKALSLKHTKQTKTVAVYAGKDEERSKPQLGHVLQTVSIPCFVGLVKSIVRQISNSFFETIISTHQKRYKLLQGQVHYFGLFSFKDSSWF